MEPDEVYEDDYLYRVSIYFKSKNGYKFKNNQALWLAGNEGKKIFVNGKGIVPNNTNLISNSTIMEVELYVKKAIKSDNIDTTIELDNEYNFEEDYNTNVSEEDKNYLTIGYDKDTLKIKWMSTGKQGYQNDGCELLYIDRNLETWYAFKHKNEFKLISDNRELRLKRIYESPVTVYYNKETLKIREIKKGLYDKWGMTVGDNEFIDRYDYNFIIADAKDYGTTSSYMYKHKEDYKIVKNGDDAKLEEKDYNDILLNNSKLQNGQTTLSAVIIL